MQPVEWNSSLTYQFIGCFLGWRILYETIKFLMPILFSKTWHYIPESKVKGEEKQDYFVACCVSTTHAVVVTIYGIHIALNSNILSLKTFDDHSDEALNLGCIFAGYLVHDTVLVLTYAGIWSDTLIMCLHHGSAIYCAIYLMYNDFGHVFIVVTAIMEISTPFADIRWILDCLELKSNPVYLINGVIFTLLWFIVRICFFGWTGWKYIIYELRPLLLEMDSTSFHTVQGGYIVGYGLQVYWFYLIFKGLMKAMGKLDSKGNKKKQ